MCSRLYDTESDYLIINGLEDNIKKAAEKIKAYYIAKDHENNAWWKAEELKLEPGDEKGKDNLLEEWKGKCKEAVREERIELRKLMPKCFVYIVDARTKDIIEEHEFINPTLRNDIVKHYADHLKRNNGKYYGRDTIIYTDIDNPPIVFVKPSWLNGDM